MAKRKRRIKKQARNFFLIILILLVSAYIGSFVERKVNFKNIPVKVSYDTQDTHEISKTSLCMIGDALIHDSVYNHYKTKNGYNFDPMLKQMNSLFNKYDLKYYNQETLLGGSKLGLSNFPFFNSPYEVGDAFVKQGFNLVSLATNHTMDVYYRDGHSLKSLTNSRNYWNKQTGVIASGSYTSQEERDKLQIQEINGITYTLLSYTIWDNGLSVPSGKGYLSEQYTRAKVKKDVQKYQEANVDLIMVAMHWGTEGSHYVNDFQKSEAKYLASLGVNIVIGCHPHVVQPITYVGDTLVIYSLGNFVSSQHIVGIDNVIGLFAACDIEKEVYHGKTTIKILNPQAQLTYTTKNYVVYPFDKLNNSILSNYKSLYNSNKYWVTQYSNKVKMMGI